MKIKWTADARALVVPDGDAFDEVEVAKGKVVDLPSDIARSLVEQGHAEAQDKKKPTEETV